MANGDWVGYYCLDKIYQIFSEDLNLQPGGKHLTKTVLYPNPFVTGVDKLTGHLKQRVLSTEKRSHEN